MGIVITKSRLFFCLLSLSTALANSGYATDGTITFTGRIVEPTCSIQLDNPSTAKLAQCAAKSAKVTSQVVTPQPHMLVWRANQTQQKDLPVNQWKVIQITYL